MNQDDTRAVIGTPDEGLTIDAGGQVWPSDDRGRESADPHLCTDYELCKHCGQCHACCGCY